MDSNEARTKPLEGFRILELGSFIAGPTGGRLLADFGAEVIKVERPVVGDEARTWRLYAGDTSMLYRTLNRNKKSVEIDLRTQAGRETVLELVAQSDAVIESFRPGTLEKWGLGIDVLSAVNPDIIVSRISAYGQTGPLAAQPGFAAVAEAFGGLREVVGEPDRPPVRVGVSLGDSIAGIYAAFGVVMGLLQRSQGSKDAVARTFDVALYEAVFSVMESLVPDYLAYGSKRERLGGRVEGIAPSNSYLCQDGKRIIIAGNGDSIFARLMRLIGRPDLLDEAELRTNSLRWQQRDRLDGIIEEWTSQHPMIEALRVLEEVGVPAGPIYTADDIIADAQYAARDMIQYFTVDSGLDLNARVGFPGIVPVIGSRSLPVQWPGPDLGAHNQEILRDRLGLTPEAYQEVTGGAESVSAHG